MAAIAAILMLGLSALAFIIAFRYRSRRMDIDVRYLF